MNRDTYSDDDNPVTGVMIEDICPDMYYTCLCCITHVIHTSVMHTCV